MNSRSAETSPSRSNDFIAESAAPTPGTTAASALTSSRGSPEITGETPAFVNALATLRMFP